MVDAGEKRVVEGRSEPLAYAFSGIDLDAKSPPGGPDAGRWQSIGNASSQRP